MHPLQRFPNFIPRLRPAWLFALLSASIVACVAPCRAFASPASSDRVEDGTSQWRSALHYTPQRNWMNDPNGLVYHNGLYHLFYQYNPAGNAWGNMSWGHATSRDLLHWREHPVAMHADANEEIFSGSIVVDARNSSGLGAPHSPPLVALYTSAYKEGSGHAPGIQAQSLAYSLDDGKTWQPYKRNPVLTLAPESKQFRDPKVSWYAPGAFWLMSAVVADAHVVKMYRSDNLIDWTFLSDFSLPDTPHREALWEMPDLFPVPLDGDSSKQKWVMIVNVNPWSIAGGSGAMYFVGDFDGKTFKPEHMPPAGSDPSRYLWLDHGADYYAAGTFAGAPGGAPVTIGWMSNWDYADRVPTTPWKGAMALPRKLALKTINGTPQLTFEPVTQYAALVRASTTARIGELSVSSGTQALAPSTRGVVQDIELTISPQSAERAGLIVRASTDGKTGTRIVYDARLHTLTLDRSNSGVTGFSPAFSKQHIVNVDLTNGALRIRVVTDSDSVEVFANDGATVITDLVFPAREDDRVALFADNGTATFRDIAITDLSGEHGTGQADR
ncbi:glycoside hydrolase family 32 protein [Paraburkholderia rhynchosiae]|uniref:Levanase n=1 Tax=Paraburkholderia rhynchosiae TaxID=487049 RepID=A0A2N7WC08_9BURK|nr:glycoside hydrolase family 32 protein [Paraburkholderia rhynchosiae]PMS26927.1 levanase [Paraburkholderia rhynchosiae]CAB3727080.1 Levanase [Paraburkholderia rhynchosiae]